MKRKPGPSLTPMAAAPDAAVAVAGRPDHRHYTLEHDYKFEAQGDMTALLLFRYLSSSLFLHRLVCHRLVSSAARREISQRQQSTLRDLFHGFHVEGADNYLMLDLGALKEE